ncbi:MAG: hypothetical protein IJL02_05370 [Methanobrevibacter sp.]|nr:hypothetical protein [Methanobrevibacter sp.]MBQ6099276.1 hypothetical protein [Methanobrevibacter sp.]
MVKSMGSLIVGILCLLLALVTVFVFKRYIAATGSALIAIACIYNAFKA